MTDSQLMLFLQRNKGYLKKHPRVLANRFSLTEDLVRNIMDKVRVQNNNYPSVRKEDVVPTYKKPITEGKNIGNILIVGDLHSPFILPKYLEWCKELEREYKCTKVIFIGDLIDGHSWSYHESDVDGMGVGDELEAAKKQLQLAYKLFPKADVCLGNHDLLIARKARTAGLSRHFIKDFRDVIEAPKEWSFAEEYTYDNVRYIHGSIGNAFTRAKDSRISTVQGHLHSQAFLQYSVSEKDAIFGLQLGCGVDHKAYAFEYAKPMTKKPVISAGVVLDNGSIPILRLMEL